MRCCAPQAPSSPGARAQAPEPAAKQLGSVSNWSCRTPKPRSLRTPKTRGRRGSLSGRTRSSLAACAAGHGSRLPVTPARWRLLTHARSLGFLRPLPGPAMAPSPAPQGLVMSTPPSGARTELRPGPRRAPPRPASPPRPLAPGLDPARTRGPAPHGCRATGGRPSVAPRRRLRPRASCPCVSSGHSWAYGGLTTA